jgi:hypothetical protein
MLKKVMIVLLAGALAGGAVATTADARGGGGGGGHGGGGFGGGGGLGGAGRAGGFGGGGFPAGHSGGMAGRNFGAAPRADVGRGFAFHDRGRGHDRDGRRFGRFGPGFAYYGYGDYDCGRIRPITPPGGPNYASWRSYYCNNY